MRLHRLIKIETEILLLLTLLLFSFSCDKDQGTNPEEKTTVNVSPLHTEGRWIVNDEGKKMMLRGVNIPSLEWTSTGDNMLESVEEAITVWGCNILRIPLAQDRWFGKTSEQNDEGRAYQALVDRLIEAARAESTYTWLDLHWNNGGEWGTYIGQHIMPDKYSLEFWKDVAVKYKNDPAVLFGIYNEPYGISWEIWRNGGTVDENYNRNGEQAQLRYEAVGHQQLVDSIRALGANNIVIAAGIDWGYDLSGVLKGYALSGENIVYDTHPYPGKDANWDAKWGNIGEQYPLIVGEWGTSEKDYQYFNDIKYYLKQHQFCWLAWCFHPDAGPQLLEDWNYTPTFFGEIVMQELATPMEIED